MEFDIDRAKDLIAKREEIDGELMRLFGGKHASRKPQHCSQCNQEGHTARNCPSRNVDTEQ